MMFRTLGLFDIQVNGFAGIDFNAGKSLTAEMVDVALEAMLACGVTQCLPTLITASFHSLQERLTALDYAVKNSSLGPVMVPGYHLEGPFLNPTDGYSGCHPADVMCAPDAEQVLSLEKELSRPILLVTYAPEFDQGHDFASTLSRAGKLLAIGHSEANSETISQAAAAGLRMSTHLGNGLPQILPKLDNTLFAQLGCDALMASFIADGIHIPAYVLKTLLRGKGLERSILVTDAVSAAAVEKAGLYQFAGMDIERAIDGSVRIPGSRYLAGSSLTLDQAVRNIVRWGITDFANAVALASERPRRLLQPIFDHHDINLFESEVVWNEAGYVVEARIGPITRTFHQEHG